MSEPISGGALSGKVTSDESASGESASGGAASGESASGEPRAARTLHRPAGYSVATECLRVQSQKPVRTILQRLFGAEALHPDAVSWYRGAIGEIRVGRLLTKLDEDWTVVHSLSIGTGDSDVDHLVIGPAGVFTLNTKRHAGKRVWVGARTVLVDGHKQDHLRNARYEAKRVARTLSQAVGRSVIVHPIVVVDGARSLMFKKPSSDITVIASDRLVTWLRRRKRTTSASHTSTGDTPLSPALDTAMRGLVVSAVSDPRLWHPTADGSSDPSIMLQFDALRAQVTAADRVRRSWALALAAGAFGSLYYLTATFLPALVSALFVSITGR